MVNDESLIREVDEDLAEEDMWRQMRAQGPFVIGGAAAIVLGVAGWQIYTSQKAAAADDAARTYSSVVEVIEAQPADAIETLSGFAGEAPAGYANIARLQLAAAYAARGERAAALNAYREIYADGAAGRLGDLARVRAAYLSFEDGRDAVLADIGDLEADQSPIGFYAREAIALASLRIGDYQTAESLFESALASDETPPGVKTRAVEFSALAAAGRQGAAIPWPEGSTPADIFDGLDIEQGDLGAALQRVKDAREGVSEDAGASESGAAGDNGQSEENANGVVDRVAGAVGDALDGAAETATDAITETAAEAANSAANNAAEAVGAAADAIESTVKETVDGAAEKAVDVVTGVEETLNSETGSAQTPPAPESKPDNE